MALDQPKVSVTDAVNHSTTSRSRLNAAWAALAGGRAGLGQLPGCPVPSALPNHHPRFHLHIPRLPLAVPPMLLAVSTLQKSSAAHGTPRNFVRTDWRLSDTIESSCVNFLQAYKQMKLHWRLCMGAIVTSSIQMTASTCVHATPAGQAKGPRVFFHLFSFRVTKDTSAHFIKRLQAEHLLTDRRCALRTSWMTPLLNK